MRREDLFMDILGDLDEKYVSIAMPHTGDVAAADTSAAVPVSAVDLGGEMTAKDRVMYWVTRSLGMAAAAFVVIGTGVLLWMNRDTIFSKDTEITAISTTTAEPVITVTAANTTSEPTATTDTEPAATTDTEPAATTGTEPSETDGTEPPETDETMSKEPTVIVPIPTEPNDASVIIDNEPDGAPHRPLEWANPGSGAGTDWDTEPTKASFYLIPIELMVKADGVVKYDEDSGGYVIDSEERRYSSAARAEPIDRTGVDTGCNIYTFIKFFDISDEDVRDALSGKTCTYGNTYTDEEIEILLSDDKAAIAAAFASRWAIVKGGKLYSPYWLQNNGYDKWEAAGITAEDISGRFDELTDVPEYLVEEGFIQAYKELLNNYIAYCEERAAGNTPPTDEELKAYLSRGAAVWGCTLTIGEVKKTELVMHFKRDTAAKWADRYVITAGNFIIETVDGDGNWVTYEPELQKSWIYPDWLLEYDTEYETEDDIKAEFYGENEDGGNELPNGRYRIKLPINAIKGNAFDYDTSVIVKDSAYAEFVMTDDGGYAISADPAFESAAASSGNDEQAAKATIDIGMTYLTDKETGGLVSMAGFCLADGTGYGNISDEYAYSGINAKDFLGSIKEQYKDQDGTDALIAALTPYCSDGGDLLADKLEPLTRVRLFDPLSSREQRFGSEYTFYLLGDRWLLEYYSPNQWAYIYVKDDTITRFRHLIEILWKGSANYPDIAATVTDDMRNGETQTYLQIIGDEKSIGNARSYLEAHGAEVSLCRFLTQEELRGSWVPVTASRYEGAAESPIDGEHYKWFMADDDGDSYRYYGVYCDDRYSTGSIEEAAERIKGYGVSEEVTERIKSGDLSGFKEISPYYSELFDIYRIKTGLEDAGIKYYAIQHHLEEMDQYPQWRTEYGVILSVENDKNGRPLYKVWTQRAGERLSELTEAVTLLRRYPVMNDDAEGRHYKIDGIELIVGDEPESCKVRVYAAKSCWNDIKKELNEQVGFNITENAVGSVEFAEK